MWDRYQKANCLWSPEEFFGDEDVDELDKITTCILCSCNIDIHRICLVIFSLICLRHKCHRFSIGVANVKHSSVLFLIYAPSVDHLLLGAASWNRHVNLFFAFLNLKCIGTKHQWCHHRWFPATGIANSKDQVGIIYMLKCLVCLF